jgi:hypothetical protein
MLAHQPGNIPLTSLALMQNVMQVTFVAPVRLLLWRPIARTEVHQAVDMSDPTSVRVSFSLLKSVSKLLPGGKGVSVPASRGSSCTPGRIVRQLLVLTGWWTLPACTAAAAAAAAGYDVPPAWWLALQTAGGS